MYKLILRSMIRRAVRRLNARDIHPLLASYATSAKLVFPGRHSFAGEYLGKERIEQFLRRIVHFGLQFDLHEIVVNGPPWRTTVCVRFTNRAAAPDGTVFYANRGVIFGRVAWGRIVFEEIYEDTQKVAELDRYLATTAGT